MARERDRIFISYRRSDAAGTTTAIRKTLLERFEGQVFHDVTGINLGAAFPDALRKELDRSVVVLAVIGEGWLGAKNEFHQRRIDFPDDWVNIELSTALSSPQVTVIPVLVDGAAMPPAKALPTELAELAGRNAVQLRHDAWDETARPLVERIEQILKPGSVSEKRSSEALTLDLVRQAVVEALDSRSQHAGQVLRSTRSPESSPGVALA
ncbi:MAG: toll/interleukin-1 receptor domain-containing protein [Chromatiales bacterium]